MKLKRFTKKPAFESRFMVKLEETKVKEVNPFQDLVKKGLSVPITLYHL